MSEDTVHRGRCLCGEVRFEARGAPERVVACHCSMCRMHTGALELYSGCFEDPEAYAPQHEIFGVNRPRWLPAFGDIPVYERFRE